MGKAATSCLKFLFLIFNFVFWLTGLALLVVGILAKFEYGYLLKLSTDINYNLAPYIMIGCGVFIVLVGLVGCWAAIKEHGWALKIYMVILVLLVIVEIAGGIAGYVMKNKISGGLKKGLQNAVNNYNSTNSDEDVKKAMDKVQKTIVKCCGVESYKDYVKDTNSAKYIPESCCKPSVTCDAGKDIKINGTIAGIYQNGCYDQLVDETKSKFKIFGGVALGIAVFQILGVIFGYLLTKQFSGNNYEMM